MFKNITLSAEEELIKKARAKAQKENTTLNAIFRQWLRQYINKNTKTTDYYEFMEKMKYAVLGPHL